MMVRNTPCAVVPVPSALCVTFQQREKSYPVQIDLTRRLDEPGWFVTFGLEYRRRVIFAVIHLPPVHLDVYREYCLSKPGAWEDLPFGPDTLVFKVMNKMFSAVGLDTIPAEVSLKCDPERVPELREAYEGIHAGPYMNKRHWNFVELQSGVPADLIRELVDHSYELVVAGMKKVDREKLAAL